MKKVFFTCQGQWEQSPTELLQRFSRQTPGGTGMWKSLQGTASAKEADYFIVLEGEGGPPLPQEKTIYVKREPNFIKPLDRHLNYKHTITHEAPFGAGITYWLNKTYDELTALSCPVKEKAASFIVSSKHSHRNHFVRNLFNKAANIDFFGRGWAPSKDNESYYKGPLNYDGNCKFLGLINYHYTIALENSQQKNYWTEKLADAYLSWCVPIYWGCPNIEDYFPSQSLRRVDIFSDNAAQAVRDAIKTPPTATEINAVGAARNALLNTYNIWEVVHRKINDIENGKSSNF